MKITIFGSCRQQPLSEYYTVSSIQDTLTYPHYTKEIIQAIEYCKGIHDMKSSDTLYCFRTCILHKREISNKNNLIREFEETDLFVIEIASRIAYEYNNLYVHHILTEEEYGFTNRDQIVQRELSDIEIEHDIVRIKELLYPKKILIVSHIYTRPYGKRYDLIRHIDRVCLRHNIPFLSPSEYIGQRSDIYQDEPVLSHFTEVGKQYMSRLYKNTIDDVCKEKKIILVLKQTYYNYQQTPTSCFWGIGDMMRSIYGVYKKSKKYNVKLILDVSQHPISNFLELIRHDTPFINDRDIPLLVNDEIDTHIQQHLNSNDEVTYIGAHCGLDAYDISEYDQDAKIYIKRHIVPNADFLSFFYGKIGNLSLSTMDVIHYRLGDSELVTNQIVMNKIERCFHHLIPQLSTNTILLSDSSSLKSYVKEKNINVYLFEHEIGHIGYDTSNHKIMNSLFEYFLLTKVQSIKTYTVYPWISGFVYSIHKIYDIPITSSVTQFME
jgi:hypothetical protein